MSFNLRRLLHGIVSTLGVAASEKGLALTVAVEDQLPQVLVGDDMRLRHARFVDWRARWSHRVDVRVWSAGQASLPSVLWTPSWTLQRLDSTRDVAVATTESVQRTRLDESLQQLWSQGRPGFPATALGL